MADRKKGAAKPRAAKPTAQTNAKPTAKPAKPAAAAFAEAPRAAEQAASEAAAAPRAAFDQLDAESRRNLEAVTASVTAAAEGAQSMALQAADFAQQTLQRYMEAARAIGGARNPQEAIEAQLSHRAAAIQAYVAELNRAATALTDVVNASLKPLNERADSLIKKR